jgi:ppGpp synthetase/RelA/SpoT-type nucleotidyltranferase
MSDTRVKLFKKPYESAVNKSFRHNVVHNQRWPDEPEDGWLVPSDWFSRLNDVIRGTIVCKYIDAPKLLAERLKERADEVGLKGCFTSKQRDAGYYAYHFYVKIPMEFDRVDSSGKGFVAEYVDLEVELQLTTQLQEVLYGITHRFYQHTRDRRSEDPDAWKWEVGSPRFRAGYLGHTLHLLEAMILELRDGESSDRTTTSQEEPNVQS